jgi:hypothetical protein
MERCTIPFRGAWFSSIGHFRPNRSIYFSDLDLLPLLKLPRAKLFLLTPGFAITWSPAAISAGIVRGPQARSSRSFRPRCNEQTVWQYAAPSRSCSLLKPARYERNLGLLSTNIRPFQPRFNEKRAGRHRDVNFVLGRCPGGVETNTQDGERDISAHLKTETRMRSRRKPTCPRRRCVVRRPVRTLALAWRLALCYHQDPRQE